MRQYMNMRIIRFDSISSMLNSINYVNETLPGPTAVV